MHIAPSSPDILHLWHSDALFEKNSPLPKARFCSLLNPLSLHFLSMRSRDVPKCYLLNLGRHCYCHIVTCDSNLCFKFLQNVLTLNVTCHNYDISEVIVVALLESFSARLQSISEIFYIGNCSVCLLLLNPIKSLMFVKFCFRMAKQH